MRYADPTRTTVQARKVDDLASQLDASRAANREIDHRAANSLSIAAAFIRMQQRRVADPDARAVLEEAARRMSAVAQAHRYFRAHSTLEEVDLAELLGEACEEMGVSLGVRCLLDLEPATVPAITASRLVMVLNELVVSTRRHDLGGTVAVSLRVRDGVLRLAVADWGPGLPAGHGAAAGADVGFQAVRATVAQLGGEFQAHVYGGGQFTVTVPLG